MVETLDHIPDVGKLDDWCKQKASALTERSRRFIMEGGNINDPEYRHLLGQHQAFMQMRSFLSGMRKSRPIL